MGVGVCWGYAQSTLTRLQSVRENFIVFLGDTLRRVVSILPARYEQGTNKSRWCLANNGRQLLVWNPKGDRRKLPHRHSSAMTLARSGTTGNVGLGDMILNWPLDDAVLIIMQMVMRVRVKWLAKNTRIDKRH
jgi:hypothetical protein